ncbi:MAG: putative addiction module antidote protein [Xanthomonadaceae bacterium]|nr:putative addiction module antidote protein [Xanthomonadaceae bacterium]
MKKTKANPAALKALGTQPFDPAAYLDDDETITEYLSAAMQDPDPDMLLEAIRTVARARGMSQLARDSGLGRESLYKALAPGAKPRYETVSKIMHALGLRLQVGAAA